MKYCESKTTFAPMASSGQNDKLMVCDQIDPKIDGLFNKNIDQRTEFDFSMKNTPIITKKMNKEF